MIKYLFIFQILQRRISNIILLSIMFSALLLIFMVGFSLKDVFYDYMRSGYGNLPDLKIQFKGINDNTATDIKQQLHTLDESMDILYGFEKIYSATIEDSEESTLTKDMPILIKGISFKPYLKLLINNKHHNLKIENLEYDDNLHLELSLKDTNITQIKLLQFLSKNIPLTLHFCTKNFIEDEKLIVDSVPCSDKIDILLQKLQKEQAKYLSIKLNSKDLKLPIDEIDTFDRTLVLHSENELKTQDPIIQAENHIIDTEDIDNIEFYDHQLIIAFNRSANSELQYKRFLAQLLKNYINYDRFILDVKNYAFGDEDTSQNPNKNELTKLDKLTDFLDMIVRPNNNTAISSSYLAGDLNNLGVLSNFTINIGDSSFTSSIRSTFSYNPEKLYTQNILIFNKEVLKKELDIGNTNNFIDIYFNKNSIPNLKDIQNVFIQNDINATFIEQNQIIPSIQPKKDAFNIVLVGFSLFIFTILFVAMYIVLRQFYSNFEDELALLKLFGSTKMYQTYINSISLLLSAAIIYFLLKVEENSINKIMEKYFFTHYSFDLNNYFISLLILFIYIIIINILEYKYMKKLNLIKGQ